MGWTCLAKARVVSEWNCFSASASIQDMLERSQEWKQADIMLLNVDNVGGDMRTEEILKIWSSRASKGGVVTNRNAVRETKV